MFPGLCPKAYDLVLQTQVNLIEKETILELILGPTLKAKLKKDYLHIYQNGEPKFSLPIKFPSLIKWEYTTKLIGFTLNETYLSDETHKLRDALAGKLFFARIQDFYTPLQVLGKGSSAKVLLVRNKGTQQYFAAKCVEKSEISYQEIEINNQLNHPAFVKIKEVFQGETSYYIIMDLLSGKNLQEIIKTNTKLTIEQTKQIMQGLLQGIEHLHQRNIMHRDLKPENLVLEKSDQVTMLKIVDFGLATYSTLKKFKFPKCGTPGYVAPEVANLVHKDHTYTVKCDIFSAGVIFYKLLTGRDVFPGNGFNYVLQLNKKCNIDITYLHLQKIPLTTIQLVTSMLSKDPSQRPSATQCLQHEFFSPQKPSNMHKKQFFQSLKNQTVEFQSPKEQPEYKGSFVINDLVKYPQMPRMDMKFNTTEFQV